MTFLSKNKNLTSKKAIQRLLKLFFGYPVAQKTHEKHTFI